VIRKPVVSTHVKSIGWESNVLEVEYSDGSVFSYKDVLESTWKLLEESESKGKFIARYIKPNYRAVKL
jgi:hypothetical protein